MINNWVFGNRNWIVVSCCLFLGFSFTFSQVNIGINKNADFNDSVYYAPAYKLYGSALRLTLHNIIKNHTVVSYNSLWTHFQTTDIKSNGKVWDMYSDIPGGTPEYEFFFGINQCGNYSGEGSCYNREHSWPQSWFSSASTPSSDIFHIYPTDGYVNNRRSNYPFGKVATASWTSTNGSKLGTSASSGYSGTVFEPINAYKGDFARSQFYMSVRYYTEDGSWTISEGTNKSDLLPWYANQLYEWHIFDSVSVKEISRNNIIYSNIQHNRNPFIDHPEFAAEIWKTDMPPTVVSVSNINPNTIIIDFSRYMDSALAVNQTNFMFDGGIGNPISIKWGNQNDISKIILTTNTLASGTIYSIQIKNQKSINGVAMNDTTVVLKSIGTMIINSSESQPKNFMLMQNYPNPFNLNTVISYHLPAGQAGLPVLSNVTLKVFDLLGQEVTTLVNQQQPAGNYKVGFNWKNLPSGFYICRLQVGQFSESIKMLLAK